jgi:hypothetical protein
MYLQKTIKTRAKTTRKTLITRTLITKTLLTPKTHTTTNKTIIKQPEKATTSTTNNINHISHAKANVPNLFFGENKLKINFSILLLTLSFVATFSFANLNHVFAIDINSNIPSTVKNLQDDINSNTQTNSQTSGDKSNDNDDKIQSSFNI